MSSWNLKFNYNGVFRRISQTTLGYAVVEDAARKLYSIPKSHRVMLTWVDDENDLIIVSSEGEFDECIRAKTLSAGSPQQLRNTIVKFGVIVEEDPKVTIPIHSKNEFQNIPQNNINTTSSNSNSSNVVHQYFTCDGCGVSPIVGDRYRCTVRNNFDLCSTCESSNTPPFPMVKLYTPDLQFKVVGNWKGIDGGKLFRVNPFGLFQNENGDSNIHRGVTCDGCGIRPISGIRYKCTVRDNFDLCSKCEAKSVQPHPMIKMYNSNISVNFKDCGRKMGMFGANGFHRHGNRFGRCRGSTNNPTESDWPRQCPIQEAINVAAEVATVIANDVDEQILQEVLSMSFDEAKKSTADNVDVKEVAVPVSVEPVKLQEAATPVNVAPPAEDKAGSSNGIVRGYASKPMARFVTDITIPDASVLNPSVNFMKIWLVRNDGPCDWPEGVTLVPAGGDPMCDANASAPVESIVVGQETHVAIALKTPSAPGRYVSYFRLQSADNIVFGQKLWVDVRVQAKPGATGWYAVPAFNNPQQSVTQPTPTVSTSIQTHGGEEKEDVDGNIWRFDDISCDIINITSSPAVSIPSSPAVSTETVVAPESVMPTISAEEKQWLEERDELEKEWSIELDALRQMGFHNTRENVELLKKHVKFSFNKFPNLQGKPFSDSLSLVVDTLCN